MRFENGVILYGSKSCLFLKKKLTEGAELGSAFRLFFKIGVSMKKFFLVVLFFICFFNISYADELNVGNSISVGYSKSTRDYDPNIYKKIQLGNVSAYIEHSVFNSYKYYFFSPNAVGIQAYFSNDPFFIKSSETNYSSLVCVSNVDVYQASRNGLLEKKRNYQNSFDPVFALDSKGNPLGSYLDNYNDLIDFKMWRSNFRIDVIENERIFMGMITYDVVKAGLFPHSSSVLQGLVTAPDRLGGTIRNLVQAMLPPLLMVVAVVVCLIFLRSFLASLDDGLEEFSTESEDL